MTSQVLVLMIPKGYLHDAMPNYVFNRTRCEMAQCFCFVPRAG